MLEQIKALLPEGLKVDWAANLDFGDAAAFAGANAATLAAQIEANKPAWLESATVAGGFVNFKLTSRFFADNLAEILKEKEKFGRGDPPAGGLKKQKIIVEYTDPNPFKEFHIGHLMSNTIGEALSRLIESQGAEVKRACYQGDVGLHVAKAVWGLLKLKPVELTAKILGEAYVLGATQGDEAEIKIINQKIYERSDLEVNKLYDEGRQISLDYFEQIYQKLGTKFDFNFFESATGEFGKKLVEEHLADGIFEKSDGAVVFKGEKYGLHTRVFINSQGLPTYEAKELGLAKIKHDAYPYDRSIVVTGNEVNDYFKVLLQALKLIFPELAAKTEHVGHGMLRLPSGKMSSRTGEVITAETLLAQVKELGGERVTDEIAVAAIKYSILRQAPGRDIIFDLHKSISFEGDSGPYLQYTVVRAKSVLAKAGHHPLTPSSIEEGVTRAKQEAGVVDYLARLLPRYPSVVARAATELAPQHLVTYLTELAAAFNAHYAKQQIIGAPDQDYQLALVAAAAQVLENGLGLLGIATPAKM